MKKFPSPAVAARVLILLILLIAIGSTGYLLTQFFHRSGGAMRAEIYQNGILIKAIDLSSVQESYSLRVDGENGAYNVIEVGPGTIGMLSASCPDKICVRQGSIHVAPQMITCLPNRLVIRLIPIRESSDLLDAITY